MEEIRQRIENCYQQILFFEKQDVGQLEKYRQDRIKELSSRKTLNKQEEAKLIILKNNNNMEELRETEINSILDNIQMLQYSIKTEMKKALKTNETQIEIYKLEKNKANLNRQIAELEKVLESENKKWKEEVERLNTELLSQLEKIRTLGTTGNEGLKKFEDERKK